MSSAAGAPSHRARRKLDVRTRTEVLRLADRGQRHPDPEVSIQAYEWASDRLLFPLWRELLWSAFGGLVGFGIAIAGLRAVDASVGLAVAIAMIILRGIGGLILHMRRRVVLVAHVNHPQP